MDAAAADSMILPLQRSTPAYERLRLLLCAALVLLGASAVIGWLAGIEALKSVGPGLPTMKFNTALGFMLAGSGLAAAGYSRRRLRGAAAVAGALMAVLGLATLLEYSARIDLGIDELFVVDSGTLRGSGVPGRMSPLTATAFYALGISIVLLALAERRRYVVLAHILASYAAVVAMLAAAGYTFGAEAFWGIGFYTYIAVHTAAGLVVAAAAALMTKAQEGWLEPYVGSPAARDLLVRLLPTALLVPAFLGLLLMLGAGLNLYNAPFAFAAFIPAMSLAMFLIALWAAARLREAELTQRRYERHLQLVVGELNHRVKNTLAIVQALAHQTLRDSVPVEQARLAFDGRLVALATAHDMLTRQNWDDLSLEEVAVASLHPHDVDGSRFRIRGPTVMLTPKACVTMAMAFHELATNATKYGALSVPDGHVEVNWTTDRHRLQLNWLEHNGPPCKRPSRDGFGSKMLNRALALELGGAASLDYAPEGFRFTLDAPLPGTRKHLH